MSGLILQRISHGIVEDPERSSPSDYWQTGGVVGHSTSSYRTADQTPDRCGAVEE